MADSDGQTESVQDHGNHGSSGPATTTNEELGNFIVAHLGMLLAALPITLAIIRLIRVSNLDPTLLLTLLQTLNVASILLATLTQYGPFLVFFLALVLGIFRARSEDLNPQSSLMAYILLRALLLLGYLAIFLISIQQLLTLVILAVVYIGFEAFFAWQDRRAQKARPRADLVALSMMLLVTFLVTPRTMWLPLEVLTMANGSPQVGYVLSSDDKRLLFLVDKDRSLEEIKTDQIKAREPCRLHPYSRPIIAFISGDDGPNIRKCPKHS